MVNESVRRQIYIVRTSGARLLALINDVMDAAALRQHRLVLKQERLDLRQVVSDVSDLTRSLVDNDVYLKNDVPEGMVVWADSGRFVQVRSVGVAGLVRLALSSRCRHNEHCQPQHICTSHHAITALAGNKG